MATVTSAVKLENEQQFQIAKKLQEITGAIRLHPVRTAHELGNFTPEGVGAWEIRAQWVKFMLNARRPSLSNSGAKNIKLKPEVDASLIGGLIVQFGKDGSGFIDLSVKGAVEKITGSLAPATA